MPPCFLWQEPNRSTKTVLARMLLATDQTHPTVCAVRSGMLSCRNRLQCCPSVPAKMPVATLQEPSAVCVARRACLKVHNPIHPCRHVPAKMPIATPREHSVACAVRSGHRLQQPNVVALHRFQLLHPRNVQLPVLSESSG